MTGNQQRKFCSKCSTHVHDLTDYSEEEILALKVQNGGKLCGAFRLAKPLTIGAGIASLALASCQPEPPLLGVICPPETENTQPIEVLRGRVSLATPDVSKPTSEKPPEVAPTISPPSIERKVPHEGIILGEIAPPKVEPPELIFGDICISDEV